MYQHTVHYYETDKMGITHHSNYIRWMEEARIAFLAEIGWDFVRLEAAGIVSPVTAVDCKYKQSTVFSEVVNITVSVEEFRGVKLKLAYLMENAEGKTVCEAHSEHCFLDQKGMPLRLKKEHPDFYDTLIALAAQEG